MEIISLLHLKPVPNIKPMPQKQLRLPGLLLLFILLCFANIAFAQDYKKIESRIDSLAKIGLPKSALAEVARLDQLAQKNKNAPEQIKAAIYQITFQSKTDEKGILSIIDTLKKDANTAIFPVKPVLQSLLAEMYWSYYQQNRWQFNQRTHLEKPGDDISKWDLQTIIDETSRLYRLSVADVKAEQQTSISVLDGVLTGNKNTRYLRPTLYDLLLQRALDFFLSEEPGLTRPKLPFSINDARFFGDSQTFSKLLIKTEDTTSTFYQGIKLLQQVGIFHLKNNDTEALADLDLQRLEFLRGKTSLPNKDSLYLGALNKIAIDFSSKPISAQALEMEGLFYQRNDSLKTALYYYHKALAAYPDSYGGKNSAVHIEDINQKNISALVEAVNVPGKPLLALLNYRNIQTARIQVYKITATKFNELAKISSDDYPNPNGLIIYPSQPVFDYLKSLTPVQNQLLNLPGTRDYRLHNAEFKINGGPTGVYILTVEDTTASERPYRQLTTFKVTRFAYASRRSADGKTEIMVMDRETGKPMPGVKVTFAEGIDNNITDANGACISGLDLGNSIAVKLTTITDTLYVAANYNNGVLQSQYPDKATNRTILFTDRSLYRPGQTVYFKGLCIQAARDKNSILANNSITVKVKDNNGKDIASVPETTNDFGTFSGSFIIPQNILNGYIIINAGLGDKYIRVEEYKRPTFQAEFFPVTQNYKIDDSVKVKGKITAFSGYGLSLARVAYHVERRVFIKDYRKYNSSRVLKPLNSDVIIIANDTIKADDKGEFEIKFKATPETGVDLSSVNYRFVITADVTDGSGETQSVNGGVTVGVNNFEISSFVPQKIFTRDSIRINAQIVNLNNVPQKGTLQFRIYAVNKEPNSFKARQWAIPDQHLITAEAFKKDFPDYAYSNEPTDNRLPVKYKVADITKSTTGKNSEIFNLEALRKQPTGTYKIVIDARNAKGGTASITRYVYLQNQPSKPQTINDWVTPLVTTVDAGKAAEFLVGNGTAAHVLMETFNGAVLRSSKWLTIKGNQQPVEVPVGFGEKNVRVQFLMSYHNRIYNIYQDIYINNRNRNLDVRFLTFRDKLQPGEKEQWKLQVSGKNNEKIAAEIVAGLYDASLDNIAAPDNWKNDLNANYIYIPRYFTWNVYNSASIRNASFGLIKNINYNFIFPRYERFATFNYRNGTLKNDTVEYRASNYNMVTEEDPNRIFTSNYSLNEVSVGYSQINIRGGGQVMKATVNGKDFMGGGVRQATQNLPADILKNIQTVDDYGDQASNSGAANKPIAIRKNFNETAFFYPQLRTNENGEILIDFTIPEALTKWRFRAFAHTKNLESGYLESEVVTQKKLSISANMPRFFREGDTITVSARLANLTADALKGNIKLQLFNGINMQPIKLLANPKDSVQSFDIVKTSTKAISFKIIIPAGLDAITYRLTAAAGNYSDGEENTFPVLPNRMLVTESMPMMVRAGQTKLFAFDKLVNQSSTTLKSKTLTLEYTQNPAWYAVQALPYLMEFPYECSEQTFSRFYANSLATSLVNRIPVIKQVFDQWKSVNSSALISNLEKNQELKATLIEETPWLRDAISETEQKKRIALLFDLNKMSYEMQTNLEKLQTKQLSNGAFPWFGGSYPDRYITQYILAGMGQLYHLNIVDTKNQTLKNISDKAMAYLDVALIDDENRAKKDNKNYGTRDLSPIEIHAYYTQSYFTVRSMSAEMQGLTSAYLKRAETHWVGRNVYEQAMIALTMLRNKKPEVAKMILNSLKETSQQSSELGMYWAKNTLGYYWYQSPIATQSLMIELFTEAGDNDKSVEEMKIWLLRNKQTNNWKTTTATASACYALLLKGDNWIAADNTSPNIKLNGKDLSELKPDVKADIGTGYLKTSWIDELVKPGLGNVSITNSTKTVNWGALHWQYLENLDKITPSQTGVQLERKYFISKQTNSGEVLAAVDAMHQPKTGDLLKVVVYLKADRDFEYIQLKDMRPAGTEPVDVLSGYKYQDGLWYYQVTKDVATNFFISNLNKGSYVFEYRLRVAQPGNFSTGITTMQSMYAPEFNSHSEGMRLSVKP
jgi:hypothetical protein